MIDTAELVINPNSWQFIKINPPSVTTISDDEPFENLERDDYQQFVCVGDVEFKTLYSINNIIDILKEKIFNVAFPEEWREEGITPPSIMCKYATCNYVNMLLNDNLLPDRISATIEGGMFMKYYNPATNKELSIEIYNDLEIAAIITINKKIIGSYDLNNELPKKVLSIFKAKQIS